MTGKFLEQSPEKILFNGKVISVDKSFTLFDAVAIKDGRFMALGEDRDILPLAGPNTHMIDLEGHSVLPGLIDSHNHMTDVSLSMQGISLEGAGSISDILKVIGKKAQETEAGEWIVTSPIGEPAISHLLKERRYPNRWDLDMVSPNHPVCIVSFHVFIVNSMALKAVGIDLNTPEPEGGTIGKDPDNGSLTGILYEQPAMDLIRPFLPVSTFADNVHGLQEACRRYNACGLTSICQHGLNLDELRYYQELWRHKKLSVRCYVHLWIDPGRSLEEIEDTIRHFAFTASPGFGDDILKIGGAKVIFDGGVGIGTALMREAYVGPSGRPSHGTQVIATDKFLQIARLCNKYNLRLAQHDSGGKAIDTVLDVYDRVDSEKSITDKRFIMVHCQFPTRANLEQIRKLGVVIPTQTVFLYTMGVGYLKYLGEELADTAVPLKDWMESGLPVALGSDAPINSFNPFLGIWHAVTRKDKSTGRVIGPNQRISREDAIRCYTINGAYISFEEHLKGSIELGKLADLAVLDRDILTCPTDEIKETRVLMTLLGGRTVFKAE